MPAKSSTAVIMSAAEMPAAIPIIQGSLPLLRNFPGFVKVKLCLTSQLAVARHFGADVENCLFKILVFGVVYFKHQFVNRFYQLYTLLFSTFQDYKMYYRKNMLNYTLRILVFNRKVWKTTVFSTYLGENRSETVENSVETV